jgi:predicted naringenin-chalcone synthase
MSTAILGIGTALPGHRVTQQEATKLAIDVCCRNEEQAALVQPMYRRSEIATRYMAVPPGLALELSDRGGRRDATDGLDNGRLGPGTEFRMRYYRQEAAPLAQRAAQIALDRSKVAASQVTHLVTVSCTGFQAPGVDIQLVEPLGLPRTVERVHVGFMGCHGAINGLRVVRSFCAADRAARVLLCAVELCSLHYYFDWDPKKLVGNALFGDGAAAVVGSGVPIENIENNWFLIATGSYLFPNSERAMTWQIGDHGFEMTLSARVPSLIAENLRCWLEGWLLQQGMELRGIRSWAVHPGGPRILSAVERALSLDREATAVSREVLSECGNMSSPTILFILDRLQQRDAPRPCVALAFGPGLTVEAGLFQ